MRTARMLLRDWMNPRRSERSTKMTDPKVPRPRSDLDRLTSYVPDAESGLKLNSNESRSPVVEASAFVDFETSDINRYPDPDAVALSSAVADYVGVDSSRIICGVGSNELLLNVCLAYGGAGRRAATFQPTYSMQLRQILISGTTPVVIDKASDFSIDFNAAISQVADCDLVFICSPDNPTGLAHSTAAMIEFASRCNGLVVVDEAYFEFSGESVVDAIGQTESILVTRTLSKAFALAGARVGYAIADPRVIENLVKVRMPYSLSSPAQHLGCAALQHTSEMQANVAEVVATRELLFDALSAIEGVQVWPSQANFVLFRPENPLRVLEEMRNTGVIIRNFIQTKGCEGCLRVTATNSEEAQIFLDALATAVAAT